MRAKSKVRKIVLANLCFMICLGFLCVNHEFTTVSASVKDYHYDASTGILTFDAPNAAHNSTVLDGDIIENFSPKKVVVEEGYTEIVASAFPGTSIYKTVESITLPSTITKIGDYAFEDCESLKRIDLPSGVTSLGENAFINCTSLSEVTLPAKITKLNRYLFEGCSALSQVTIPSSVTEIDSYAFENSGLTSICIPQTVHLVFESKNVGQENVYRIRAE